MKTYETIIILDDRRVHDEGAAFAEEFCSQVTAQGGENVGKKLLGRRQFAREIRRRKTGYYWDFIINLNEAKVTTLWEKFKLDDRILRYKAFIYDRPVPPAERFNRDEKEAAARKALFSASERPRRGGDRGGEAEESKEE